MKKNQDPSQAYWHRWYKVIIIWLALLILLFFWFTRHWQ